MAKFEEFTEANGTVVRYHIVDGESATEFGGSVVVVGGNSQQIVPGNILVESDRPGVYVVVNNTDALGIPEETAPSFADALPDDEEVE